MGMLNEPIGPFEVVEDPDAETVTRRRLESNAVVGVYMPPSPYELDFYAREGKTPPSE